MFVGVARVTLQIPESGSLKAKRQVLRRVTDRVKARFNVAVAEVDDNDRWQLATIALAVVGNESRHVNEQLEKIIQFIDDMYVAPLVSRELELVPLGDRLFGGSTVALRPGEAGEDDLEGLPMIRPDRSLAEAEGLGDWEQRHLSKGAPASHPHREGVKDSKAAKRLSLEEARAKARSLRNPRDWEKKR
jgi:uncharacterized protein YlxP (DUF503 family)